MSHYRSNTADLEFNLLAAHDVAGQLAACDLEPETVRQILNEFDRFVTEKWAPSFVAADRHHLRVVKGEVHLAPELKESLVALWEGGWEKIGSPIELGGTPVPPILFWGLQELMLGGNATGAFYASGPLFANVIFLEGTDDQKQLARLMLDRHWAGTMMLTEPDAGSDVGAGTTKARLVEGDTYELEGTKRFITSGEHDGTENIIHLVLARVEGGPAGTKGLSLFIVPKFLVKPDGTLGERNGVVCTRLEEKLGLKGSATAEMSFGAERLCVGYLVGGVHDGIRQMFRVIQHARMTIGSKSTATLSAGYQAALAYARERVQGPDLARATDKSSPRVEIINHPDVRRMLMLQKAHAEGLRALVSYTAWVQGQARFDNKPALWEKRAELLLPLVKGYSSEKAFELLSLSMQVLGGAGYTVDFPIEQYLRDAKIDSIYEGTTGIQALDLFFRKIVRDQGATITALGNEILEFVKAGEAGDALTIEREMLGGALADLQAQLGVMVENALAWAVAPERIYRVGLHANSLLESLAEVVIGWQLLRHAEIAEGRQGDFYDGKSASARFFVRHVAPKIAARRLATEAEDGQLMHLPDAAW